MEKTARTLLSLIFGMTMITILTKLKYSPEDYQFWAIFFPVGLLIGIFVTRIFHS
jgi:hypothetical protein